MIKKVQLEYKHVTPVAAGDRRRRERQGNRGRGREQRAALSSVYSIANILNCLTSNSLGNIYATAGRSDGPYMSHSIT